MSQEACYLTNLHVVYPGSAWHDQRVDLWVQGGRIHRLDRAGACSTPEGVAATDAAGLTLALGFMDVGAQACVPGHEDRQTLAQLAADALAGGFTDVLCSPAGTQPPDQPEALMAFQQQARGLPVRLHLMGSITRLQAGTDLAELGLLQQAGALAFTDGDHPLLDPALLLRAMQYVGPEGWLVQLPLHTALAPHAQMHESPHTAWLGLPATPAEAEVLALQLYTTLLGHSPCQLLVGPVTTQAGVDTIKHAVSQGINITSFTAPVYLMLDARSLGSLEGRHKVWPPLRDPADVQALRHAVADGTLALLGSHHVPCTPEEKQEPLGACRPGAPTLAQAFSAYHAALVTTGLLPLEGLLRRLALTPRQLLGLPLPQLEEGAPAAEWVVIDPHAAGPTPAAHGAAQDPFLGLGLLGRAHNLAHWPVP